MCCSHVIIEMRSIFYYMHSIYLLSRFCALCRGDHDTVNLGQLRKPFQNLYALLLRTKSIVERIACGQGMGVF